MQPPQLFFLLLLLLGTEPWLPALAQNSNQPSECCFSHFTRKISKKLIVSYEDTRGDCPKKGIIFYTRRAKSLCVNPDEQWVQSVMEYLDKRNF